MKQATKTEIDATKDTKVIQMVVMGEVGPVEGVATVLRSELPPKRKPFQRVHRQGSPPDVQLGKVAVTSRITCQLPRHDLDLYSNCARGFLLWPVCKRVLEE